MWTCAQGDGTGSGAGLARRGERETPASSRAEKQAPVAASGENAPTGSVVQVHLSSLVPCSSQDTGAASSPSPQAWLEVAPAGSPQSRIAAVTTSLPAQGLLVDRTCPVPSPQPHTHQLHADDKGRPCGSEVQDWDPGLGPFLGGEEGQSCRAEPHACCLFFHGCRRPEPAWGRGHGCSRVRGWARPRPT